MAKIFQTTIKDGDIGSPEAFDSKEEAEKALHNKLKETGAHDIDLSREPNGDLAATAFTKDNAVISIFNFTDKDNEI